MTQKDVVFWLVLGGPFMVASWSAVAWFVWFVWGEFTNKHGDRKR